MIVKSISLEKMMFCCEWYVVAVNVFSWSIFSQSLEETLFFSVRALQCCHTWKSLIFNILHNLLQAYKKTAIINRAFREDMLFYSWTHYPILINFEVILFFFYQRKMKGFPYLFEKKIAIFPFFSSLSEFNHCFQTIFRKLIYKMWYNIIPRGWPSSLWSFVWFY